MFSYCLGFLNFILIESSFRPIREIIVDLWYILKKEYKHFRSVSSESLFVLRVTDVLFPPPFRNIGLYTFVTQNFFGESIFLKPLLLVLKKSPVMWNWPTFDFFTTLLLLPTTSWHFMVRCEG